MINIKKANSPRPDFYREGWHDLNGEWDFEFDDDKTGIREKWYQCHVFRRKIKVPYCYQSQLSGIQDTGRHPYLWYHKKVSIPKHMIGKRIWLHFGAVDYETHVWINGEFAGMHKGGHTSFQFEITPFIHMEDSFEVVVYAIDSYDIIQPRGKQHWNEKTDRCWYTATGGIWQDVWLEYAEGTRLDYARITPDIDKKQVEVKLGLSEEIEDGILEWKLEFENNPVKEGVIKVSGKRLTLMISWDNPDPIDNSIYLWSPSMPYLYDLTLQLLENDIRLDCVETYFGMRKIERVDNHFMLNHQPIYQKLVLDQGYWKESLLTYPNKESFKKDILLVKGMGFNGVRKHQKIEAPLFLYYADCLGLLVWAEMPSNYEFGEKGIAAILNEYQEMITRDYNHPSIITWVPLNESWGVRDLLWNERQQNFAQALYYLTKALDETRLVSTNDGWEAVTSDFIGIHDYEGDGEVLFEKYKDKKSLLTWNSSGKMIFAKGFSYQGEPVVLSEFGGIAFEDNEQEHWGYNEKVADEEEFLKRLFKLQEAIYHLEYVEGYCYTQLTDVEQETNGLLYADRTPKVSIEKIRKIIE